MEGMQITKHEGNLPAVDGIMTPEKVMAQVSLIQKIMETVMKNNVHYGAIPGCGDKPALLKAGAEKLCMTFRLFPEYKVTITNMNDLHREYDVDCLIKNISTGEIVGAGGGCCSTLESKYRYRKGNRICPKCGNEEAIIKGKAEYGGGWLCYSPRGGCGAKFKDGDPSIEGQQVGRVEYDCPPDYYNTCKKMAMKRALSAAIIQATAASDIFEQEETLEMYEQGLIGDDTPAPAAGAKKSNKPKTDPPESRSAKAKANASGGEEQKITDNQLKMLLAKARAKKISDEDLHKHLKEAYKVEHYKEIPFKDLNAILEWLQNLVVEPAGDNGFADKSILWSKILKYNGGNVDHSENYLHEIVGKTDPDTLTAEELYKAMNVIDADIAKLHGEQK